MSYRIWFPGLLIAGLSVSSGWSQDDAAPTADEIRDIFGLRRVERVVCTTADDNRGGYLCHFITESSGIFGTGARFVKNGDGWKTYAD